MKRLIAVTLLGGWGLVVGACGSSGPACSSTVQRFCALACRCSPEPSCLMELSNGEMWSGTSPDCNTEFNDRCETGGVDTSACEDAIDASECSGEVGMSSLVLPGACL